MLAAATTVIAAGLAVVQLKPKPSAKPVIFELTPPHQVSSVDLPRISPDGRRLAFNAADSAGTVGIWVRQMNSLEAQRLPGTEGATRPFWSPDSRFLAFFSGGKQGLFAGVPWNHSRLRRGSFRRETFRRPRRQPS